MEESAGNETSLPRRRSRKAPVRFGFEDDKDEDEEEEETKDSFDDEDDFDDQDWNRREDLDSDCAEEDEKTDNEEEEEESSDEEDEGENTKQEAEEGRKNRRAVATSDVKRKSGAQAWSNFRTKSKSRILWKGFDAQCPVCQRRGLYAYKDIRYHLQRDDHSSHKLIVEKGVEEVLNMATENMGLHSCRLCAIPLFRFRFNLETHVKLVHEMKPWEYVEEFPRALEETREERRVNKLALNLRCPECGLESLKGVRSFLLHVTSHRAVGLVKQGQGARLVRILKLVQDQLGLEACGECLDGVVLRGTLNLHKEFYHTGGKGCKDGLKDKRKARGGVYTASVRFSSLMLPCPACGKALPHQKHWAKKHLLLHQGTHPALERGLDYAYDRMCDNMKMHSCRLCAVPLLRMEQNIRVHTKAVHGLSLDEYVSYGGGNNLEETQEEKKVNAAAESLECPRCGEAFRGFHHLSKHVRSEHLSDEGKSLQFSSVFGLLHDSLGLSSCPKCKQRYLLGARALEVHDRFHHQEDNGCPRANRKRGRRQRSSKPLRRWAEEAAKMHSCRICGASLLVSAAEGHVSRQHGLSWEDYSRKNGGDGKSLEESPEEKRLNAAAMGMKCPRCGETLQGFQHFHFHVNSKHKPEIGVVGKRGRLFKNVLKLAMEQLDLVCCPECPSKGAMLREALSSHNNFFHGDTEGNFTKMHSCRVCAAPLPKRRSNITLHLQSAHKLSFVKYCGGMGLGGLEETPEGERVNAAAARFDCPRCGESIGGFRHLQEHFSSRHWRKGTDGRGAQFRAAAMMARRPLGLAKCVRCSRGPFPRDMMATHLKYWHGGGRGKRRHYRGAPRRAGEGADAVGAKTESAETELLPTIDCGGSLVAEDEDCDQQQKSSFPAAREGNNTERRRETEKSFAKTGHPSPSAGVFCKLCCEHLNSKDGEGGLEKHLWSVHDLTLELYE